MNPVAVVSCENYDLDRVTAAMREAVRQIGDPAELLGGNRRVLIKPNILSDHKPEDAVTTHPAVVRAAIRLVREAGGIPLVGDSPAIKGRKEAGYKRVCEITGILAAVEAESAELVWFDGAGIETHFPEGKIQRRFTLAEPVSKADVIFNLPKLKTHGLTVLTGAVKNLFGCVPGLKKASYHLTCGERGDHFAESLLDLALMLRPALTVMDAVIGMEGRGPSNGTPRQIGYLLAGRDPLTVDLTATQLVGAKPMEIPILRAAKGRGLLREPWPEPAVPVIRDFQLPPRGNDHPPWLTNLLKNHLVARPRIDPARCTLCGDCARICPPQAIKRIDSRMQVNYAPCIRCYCCDEVCPQDAVALKKTWLGQLFSRE